MTPPYKWNILLIKQTSHTAANNDYALQLYVDGNSPWTIFSWKEKPKQLEVDNLVNVIGRTLEVQQNHLQIHLKPLKIYIAAEIE